MEWYGDKSKQRPEILDRRRRVAELWNRSNLNTYETAKELGVSQPTIVRDRRWLLDCWHSIIKADMSDMVGREVERLAAVEAEAWKEWERSRKNKEKHQTKEGDTETSETHTTEGRLADPRYLDIVLKCQAERCKLLGLYQSVALTDVSFDFGAMVKSGYEKALEQRTRAKAAGNGG